MRYELNTDVDQHIKDYSKTIAETFLVYLKQKGRINSVTNARRQTANVTVRVFINNCYITSLNYSKKIIVPLKSNIYSKGFIINGVEQKKEKVSRQYTRWLLDFMQDNQYGTYVIGKREYESHIIANKYELVVNDTVTIFTMFEDFYCEMCNLKNNIGYLLTKNVIIVRDEAGFPKTFKHNKYTKKMMEVLLDVNEKSLTRPVKKANNKDFSICVQFRKILNVTKERGARVYNQIQEMTKEERKLLLIEDSSVICLDFKSFETSLLYSLQGEVLDSDPYQVYIEGFDSKLLRKVGKMIMTRIYYSENEFELRSSVNFDLAKEYDLDELVSQGKIPTPRIPVSYLIKELIKRHYCVSEYFFRKSQTDPAYIGSLVIDYVIDTLNQKYNMLVIPVFDEIICKVENQGIVLQAMKEGFEFVTGTLNNCIIEEN